MLATLCLAWSGSLCADGLWSIEDAFTLPAWLTLTGEFRARYETLDEQFRTDLDGGDQVLAVRTSLLAEADFSPLQITAELMDSRQYLADAGSALNTTTVNALELLQAHLEWDLGPLAEGVHHVRLGRSTLDLGSRRLMARNAYRNTINAFTGIDWHWEDEKGRSVHAFWFLPNERQPDETVSLLDNDIAFDDASLERQFWGIYATLPVTSVKADLELYVFGRHDSGNQNRERDLYTPGLRLIRKPAKGEFDFELESAAQFGQSRSASSGAVQDHRAYFYHLSSGYTFALPWEPRLQVGYDHASGDKDGNDGQNNRFDTLYGARRFEYGPTGFYGSIARSNLSSPEIRLDCKPTENTGFMAAYRGIWLASDTDAWTAAGVRDASGRSGSFIGQQIEARLRWDTIPGRLRLETGIAHLIPGRFQETAPNGNPANTTYAYFEMTWWF